MSEPQMAQCQSMHTVGFNSANLTTDAVLHEVGEESAGNAILHEAESAGKEKGRRRGKGQIQEKKERERTRNGKGKELWDAPSIDFTALVFVMFNDFFATVFCAS